MYVCSFKGKKLVAKTKSFLYNLSLYKANEPGECSESGEKWKGVCENDVIM